MAKLLLRSSSNCAAKKSCEVWYGREMEDARLDEDSFAATARIANSCLIVLSLPSFCFLETLCTVVLEATLMRKKRACLTLV